MDTKELLKKVRPGWQERKELMKTQGFRAYTTSCGWLGYSIEKVKNQYPPFKLRDDFVKHFFEKKDPGLEKACESILKNVPAILDV